ncbi:hypothetical protein WICANDRAFT_58788 [Wickerhamomyces anomalus NRRL Y-366-8]|uniref:NADP-dependent oxidoreductase domain-containing protein n=1 Tax=Wickerhamomyces anomalus (strain ATCC 58044 / CBS 1984 / NCYC 433 / NRRL Y-366-8) TaxID=683960 RepID=A0A1E3NVW0_WICAA|nr:uncharacterized protein WICANDRAFT_58788 [Wickerhamomyces anomalus NRRL Y-366-8]ODQ57130.1 hypothetical protein WICANDRAFT_58788 [Wickerhamomyces anomalus NRRL Y-366-8]
MSSETTTVVPWKNLGKSGLKISNIIIGCMGFGSKKWDPWVIEDKQEVFKILKKAYDHGIRTYDTADNYSNGLSEKILGEFLKEYKIQRDKVVIMTKFWGPTDDAYPEGYKGIFVDYIGSPIDKINFLNNRGASRKHIMDAAKNSSERLGTYIDVYQLHRFDKDTPIEETMKALNDVVNAGYTRYIGASTMRAVDFVEMQHVAEKNGWHKFISMQSLYNLLQREDESEMNYYCDKTGVGLIPWSPLMGGVLARPVPKDESEKTERIKTSMFTVFFKSADLTIGTKGQDSDIEIVNRVGEIAKTKGTSMAAVATAWVIAKGAAPIIGFTTVERVDDAVEGANLKLTEEEIKYLEEPYLPRARVA